MGFFGNIFRGNDLKNKKAEFESVKTIYLKEGESISSDSIKLFEYRKDAVRKMQRVQSYIDRLENCPQNLRKGIAKAITYTDNFRETMQWEIDAEQSCNASSMSVNVANASNIGIGGVAAGAAGVTIATMGPTAAMAIATTFGTASTGVAISSLGGIAATNAALAWLGGGAIAAGSAGMAGGSALLALAGPVGWGLAGVAALGTSIKLRSSNSKAINEIDKLVQELNGKLEILQPKHQKLRRLISSTKELNEKIELDIFLNASNDYASDDYPKDALFEIVNTCKTIGKMINETIEMY